MPRTPPTPADSATGSGDRLQIRAIGPGEIDLLARVRARCYDATYARGKRHLEALQGEGRWGDPAAGDFLVAERAGRPVGTITSLRGEMSVRGVRLPCQGIAWVGTTHDARRSAGGSQATPGVATQLMHRTLAMARERGEVATALVPFRASYYEHFGYGLVERRANWDIPTALLPTGEAEGFELLEPGDEAAERAIAGCRARQVSRGHGDVAFPAYDDMGGFRRTITDVREDGYCFVRRRADGSAGAFVMTEPHGERGNLGLYCNYVGYDSVEDFRALLCLLGTMRDQYRRILIAAPLDQPLNMLLRETQVPHRAAEHGHAHCTVVTRLQVRILDHLRLFNEAPWPDGLAKGTVTVGVEECEGTRSTFRLEVSGGRCQAKATGGGAQFACADKTWAAIAMGDVKASTAAALGLAECVDASALGVLDTLSHGPLPFCRESF
jgi:predicted acetyltransferase